MISIRSITAVELAAFSDFAACQDRGFAPADSAQFQSWLSGLWADGQSGPDRCFVAERNARYTAAVVYWRRDDRYHIEHFRQPDQPGSDGIELLARSMQALHTSGGKGVWAEVVSPPLREPELSSLRTALNSLGFKKGRHRLRFRRATVTQDVPAGDFVFRCLQEVGEAAFIAAWAEASDRSLDDEIVKARETAGPLAAATKSFAEARASEQDRTHWELACDVSGSPMGLIVAGFLNGEPVIHFYGVLPAYRGQGVGRKLLLRGIHSLATVGADSVRLDVDAANEPSVKAIRATGFEEIRSYEWYEAELSTVDENGNS